VKRKLLLLATTTGYQIRVFADAAARMDVDFRLATDRCHVLDDPWGDQAIPVRFEKPLESVEEIARHAPFDAIVAVGDRPTYLAALAAARLGIPYNPPHAVEAARSKFLARERFRAAGLRLPSYRRYALECDRDAAASEAPYPCVLKPLGLAGSRGVIRANSPARFLEAFERIAKLLHDPDILRLRDDQDRYVQVESFIPGREYALEGILTGGRLQTLALFDKPDPLDGPFFEETIYVTPSREPAARQHELIGVAQRAIEALGLTRGPVHIELRLNDEGAWILEVAARPIGGLCAKAMRFGGGMPLEEVILRHALGEDVSRLRLADAASGVMMIPIPKAGVYTGVLGVNCAAAIPGIDEVIITAKEGQKLLPLPEGSSYLGFLFARGDTPEMVEDALRESHAMLHFEISDMLPVLAL
jgi:biotin carboxylase